DASEDPWQSDECNLFALADRKGKIVALRSTIPGFVLSTAEEMLQRSLKEHATAGWWVSGRRLYQVVLQPYYADEPLNNTLFGTVVVGREIDLRRANDLGRISSSHLAFRYGNEIIVSTLSSLMELQLEQQIRNRAAPREIQIDKERFLTSSIELTPGAHPSVS